MSGYSAMVKETIAELVVANKILGHEGVMDAFGHVSARHPENPQRYFLSRSRSPELVTEDDIMEFDLDSNPIDQRGRTMYSERPIHGAAYKARPDVGAVCHSHAHQLVPFAATETSMKPIWVMCAAIGDDVPIWDIREDFPDEDGMLVHRDEVGASMARKLGGCSACLMRSHGAVIAEANLKKVVMVSMGLMINAELLMQSHTLALAKGGGKVRYLAPGEIRSTTEVLFNPRGLHRAWEYWATRAGCATTINTPPACD